MYVPASETYCASRVAVDETALSALHTRGVSAEDFVESGPAAVVEAAESLREDGDPVTSTAITHRMKEAGTWEEAGGARWWSTLMGQGADGSDLQMHAKIVRAASTLRDTQSVSTDIVAAAQNGQRPRKALEEVQDLTADLLEAQSQTEENVIRGEGLAEGIMEMLTSDEPSEVFLPTGFPCLDDLFDGLAVGRVNVVAARTGHGKSAFVDQLALNVARRWKKADAGRQVLKFDLENSETAVKTRMASNLSGVPAQEIKRHSQQKRKLADPQFDAVCDAADTIAGLPVTVETTSGADSRHIRSRCLAEDASTDVGLVIVDYVTQMGERGDGAMEKVMNAMDGLHQLAKTLSVPVVAVSQVNRKPAAGDTEPQLHHLSWSDDVAQVPAQVHMLFHPHTHWEQTDRNPGGEPGEERLYFYTRKNKGPAGARELKFDPSTLRITDPEDPQPYAHETDPPF